MWLDTTVIPEGFMHSVLFVCTANICRSPMAMGLWQAKIGGAESDAWRIGSAGTWTVEGEPATENAIWVMERRGIDLSSHFSRPVTAGMVMGYQLILTMERGHKEALKIEFPQVAERIFLLSEMIGKVFNINDPMGRTLTDFEETANEIDQILKQGFDKISQLSQGEGGRVLPE